MLESLGDFRRAVDVSRIGSVRFGAIGAIVVNRCACNRNG